jgi:hypothetical protein
VPPQCFAADFSFLTAPALTTTPPPSPQPRPPNRSGPYVFLDHWIHWVPLRDLLMLGGPEMGLQGQQICRPASFDDCFAASITLISTDDPHTFRARVLMPLQLTIVGFSTRRGISYRLDNGRRGHRDQRTPSAATTLPSSAKTITTCPETHVTVILTVRVSIVRLKRRPMLNGFASVADRVLCIGAAGQDDLCSRHTIARQNDDESSNQ